MRRIQAIVALLAILAAPLALIARGNACASSCAKYCCPLSSQRANSTPKMNCHDQSSSDSKDCCSAPVPNHVLDYGFATPLPRTLLTAAVVVEAPQISHRSISRVKLNESSISVPPPIEPPRS